MNLTPADLDKLSMAVANKLVELLRMGAASPPSPAEGDEFPSLTASQAADQLERGIAIASKETDVARLSKVG